MDARRFITILMAVLSGVCFGVSASTYLLTNGYLTGGYRAYIVQSGSMEPAIPVGAVVIIKPSSTYNAGDVITYSQNGKNNVTHRIVETKDGSFITKGDANEEADSVEVLADNIVGKSFLVLPYVGYLADFVKTPKGFVILVVIPASIVVYEEIKAVFREIRHAFIKKNTGDKKINAAVVLPLFGIMLLFASTTQAFIFDKETSINTIREHNPATDPEISEQPERVYE